MKRMMIAVAGFTVILTTIFLRLAVASQAGPTLVVAPTAAVATPAPQSTPTASPEVVASFTRQVPRSTPTDTPQPTPTAPNAVVETPTQEPTPTAEPEVIEPTEEAAPTEAVEPEMVAETVDDEATADAGTEAEAVTVEETEGTERETLAYEPELDSVWEWAIQTPGGGLMGVVVGGSANVRSAPSVDAPIVAETYGGHLVVVYGVTLGDAALMSDLWYVIGPDAYIAAGLVEPFYAPEPEATFDGHWVDVNLSAGYAVAYDGPTPVYAAIAMVGKPGFETPTGAHTIIERVAVETLDSATVGIPEGDPEHYYIQDVYYTQYFAEGGFALHTNYWDAPWLFGSASSHGCVNLLERDAAWFWDFLDYGSVVNVHY